MSVFVPRASIERGMNDDAHRRRLVCRLLARPERRVGDHGLGGPDRLARALDMPTAPPTHIMRSTGHSSEKLGNCEVCHQPAAEVFVQHNLDVPGFDVAFGHQECLLALRSAHAQLKKRPFFVSIGRKGGSSTSPAKVAASRTNAIKRR